MLVKNGYAEIISVVYQEAVKDDTKRKDALADALAKAKERISEDKTSGEKDNTTEN